MGFSDKQLRALRRQVPPRFIKSRMSGDKELSYIEGWYAITEANRIFGHDGWDRETVEVKCLQAKEARGTWSAVYSARVRIKVRSSEDEVIRDGHGTGEAYGQSLGEVHDRAMKAAETDATKRALATFGKPFGLALYAGLRPVSRALEPEDLSAQKGKVPADGDAAVAPTGVPHGEPAAASLDAEARNRGRVLASAARPHRVEKSALALSEPARVRDKEHLRFVAAQPCLLCGTTPSDAHHVRYAQPRAMSRKVSDEFTVPLCRAHHNELHQEGNEAAWWHDMGIDPLEIAKRLWEESGQER
jgi:DNA recombination protein Rad52